MPESPSWPPPPNIPEPLTGHDDFLAACVRNSTLKPPLSRLRLVKNLRDETGLDLRSCLATVNSFCNRHAILLPSGGLWARAGCLLPFLMFTMIAAMTVSWTILERRHDAAATHLERTTITAERVRLDLMFLGVYLLLLSASMILTLWRIKKMREQAAEAREKFA